ncbi:MAG: hypothetical protein NT029_15565 [Armatimonadetes bacterium]|nr:hypothetical protein [Armatimonadota bacterium]
MNVRHAMIGAVLLGCVAPAMAQGGATVTQNDAGAIEVRIQEMAGQAAAEAQGSLEKAMQLFVTASSSGEGLPDARITIHFDNTPARDALRRVCEAAKVECVVGESVPKEARVPKMSFTDCPADVVIHAVARAAGSSWSIAKTVVNCKSSTKLTFRKGAGATSIPMVTLGSDLDAMGGGIARVEGMPWRVLAGMEQKLSIDCPACGKKVTVMQKRQEAKCAKCGMALEPDWKVCPRDGARRPDSPSGPKFCPYCGKGLPQGHERDDLRL